jgi:O-acetylserine/cysteine efflux transporter
MRKRHLAFLLMINLLWGINIVPTKWLLTELPPLTAAVLRFALVLLICLPWLRWLPGQMPRILAIGALSGGLMFGINNIAFAIADNVSSLAIAGQLGVPFSLLLAIFFLGERIRWIRALGIVLAFTGVVFLVFDPHAFDDRVALSLGVLGAFVYAVGTILTRQLRDIPALTLQAWTGVASLPPLLAASLIFEPGSFAAVPALSLRGWGSLVFVALAGSIIGHAGVSWLLQRYSVQLIAPVLLLAPLIGVIASTLVLGNPLTPLMILGGLITLAGVGIITWRNAQKSPEQKPGQPL